MRISSISRAVVFKKEYSLGATSVSIIKVAINIIIIWVKLLEKYLILATRRLFKRQVVSVRSDIDNLFYRLRYYSNCMKLRHTIPLNELLLFHPDIIKDIVSQSSGFILLFESISYQEFRSLELNVQRELAKQPVEFCIFVRKMLFSDFIDCSVRVQLSIAQNLNNCNYLFVGDTFIEEAETMLWHLPFSYFKTLFENLQLAITSHVGEIMRNFTISLSQFKQLPSDQQLKLVMESRIIRKRTLVTR
jgi:hypothetical protein